MCNKQSTAASVESEVLGAVASSANMHSRIGVAVTAEIKVEIGVEVKVEVKGTVKSVCNAPEVEIAEGRSGVERIEVRREGQCSAGALGRLLTRVEVGRPWPVGWMAWPP